MWSVIIKRGTATTNPQLMSSGYGVNYAFQDNTYSVGKTDFWTYAPALFGVNLPPNIGLTGKGMTGSMDLDTDHFKVVGTPITPYTDLDLVNPQPFQLANLQAVDPQNNVIATTQIVAPISNEITCDACHHAQNGGTVEQAILTRHDSEEGTHLMQQRPVLCASCHADAALGAPGKPGIPNLSLAMHGLHGEETNDCYKCHPGPVTRCLRDVMSQQYGLVCQDCHGSVSNVAHTIEQGRQPWLQEPRCGDCHGAQYAEMPNTLYRNSNNGHGGLYCETCHNSTHAVLPSREERDNRQTLALQGHTGTLSDCTVCHGTTPSGPGPHGLYPTGVRDPRTGGDLAQYLTVAPNPVGQSAVVNYRVLDSRPVRLAIHDLSGREVRVLTERAQTPGDHALVWDGRDANSRTAPAGVYFVRLESGGKTATKRLVKIAN
jgi:hypothetical protein